MTKLSQLPVYTPLASDNLLALRGTSDILVNAGAISGLTNQIPVVNQTLATISAQYPAANYAGFYAYSSDQGLVASNGVRWYAAIPVINVMAFGADPTGGTDSTAAITSAFNAAIANASAYGASAVQFPVGTFLVSSALPQITASGVQIIGVGTDDTHNGGSPAGATTTLKWNGGVSAATMITIAPAVGAAQYLTGIKFTGINIDCNAGNLANGVQIGSMRAAYIDIYVIEAGTAGCTFAPNASLTSDPCDIQFNNITYKGKQLLASGISLVLNGTSTANTSLNLFQLVDISHKNGVAINSVNCDSNVFLQVRLYHAAGGSASYSWTFQGSNTSGANARSEQIFRLSATLPAYATGLGLTYPAGVPVPIKIYNIDKNNGAPDPTMDITSPPQLVWQNDSTPMFPEIWTSYTPTVTNGGSGFVSGTVTARYLREPKKCTVLLVIPVTTAGTGTSFLTATLPPGIPSASGSYTTTGVGWDNNLGYQVTTVLQTNSTTVNIYKTSSGGYPVSSGSSIVVTFSYETS